MRRALQGGFTLVEIAIALVIFALVLSGFIAILNVQQTSTRISTTQQKQQAIKQALIAYVAKNNFLPCPADPSLQPGAANYGMSQPNADPAVVCSGVTTTNGPATHRGVLPFVTLGLTEPDVFDGYHQRFTYIVTSAATKLASSSVASMRGNMLIHSTTPVQIGLAAAGNQINGCSASPTDTNTCNNYAVVVLISHGQNGNGAFVADGSQSAVPAANVSEQQNASLSLTNLQYVQGQLTDNPSASGGPFDDILMWLKPDDLLLPLNKDGAIASARSVTNDRLKVLQEAVNAQIVNGSGAVPALLPAGAGLNANDGWEQAFTYVQSVANVCGAAAGSIAFTITSNGPDLQNATASDNIVLSQSADQLKSRVMAISGSACP